MFVKIHFSVFKKKNHTHRNSLQPLMNELQCVKSRRHLEVFLVISIEVCSIVTCDSRDQ